MSEALGGSRTLLGLLSGGSLLQGLRGKGFQVQGLSRTICNCLRDEVDYKGQCRKALQGLIDKDSWFQI